MKNKTSIYLILFLFLTIIILFISNKYKYDKCIRTNNEEFKKCQDGKYGNYDCSVFENPKEFCSI